MTRISLIIFLAALIGASVLAARESGYECTTDTECEIEAATRCFILCEG